MFYKKPLLSGSDDDSRSLSSLYIDLIVNNDTTQDSFAVCSIVEAVLAHVKEELSGVVYTWFLSNNATCYANRILPVMAPYMAQDMGIRLRGMLHSETR